MNGSDISMATGAGMSLLGLDVHSLYGPVIHVSISWGGKTCLLLPPVIPQQAQSPLLPSETPFGCHGTPFFRLYVTTNLKC